MKFSCLLTSETGGRWRAVHESRDLGRVEALAESREAAVEKLKGEIRYRLELCPCTGESYQHIDVEVETSTGSSSSPSPG
jgi:hypothetical protein